MRSTASNTVAERYARGWAKLREVDGEAGEHVIDGLRDVSPDLSRYLIEYCFGDIYSRGKLDLKTTELVVVAAPAAMGTAELQLKVHLHEALNTGNSRQEVVEALLQVAVFAGLPAALKGIVAAREVLVLSPGNSGSFTGCLASLLPTLILYRCSLFAPATGMI